jgi:hypothetical protein
MAKRKRAKTSKKLPAKKKRLSVRQMLAIGKAVRKAMSGPRIDHAEFLYDENGLPK